jgi:hypothetical protein
MDKGTTIRDLGLTEYDKHLVRLKKGNSFLKVLKKILTRFINIGTTTNTIHTNFKFSAAR